MVITMNKLEFVDACIGWPEMWKTQRLEKCTRVSSCQRKLHSLSLWLLCSTCTVAHLLLSCVCICLGVCCERAREPCAHSCFTTKFILNQHFAIQFYISLPLNVRFAMRHTQHIHTRIQTCTERKMPETEKKINNIKQIEPKIANQRIEENEHHVLFILCHFRSFRAFDALNSVFKPF